MGFELSPRIIYETKRIYGEKESDKILKILSETDIICDYKDEVERIRLGILLGSKKDEKEFQIYIHLSKIDYRDVLWNSGLGNSDWKEVLIKNGFVSMRNNQFNEENKNQYIYK